MARNAAALDLLADAVGIDGINAALETRGLFITKFPPHSLQKVTLNNYVVGHNEPSRHVHAAFIGKGDMKSGKREARD